MLLIPRQIDAAQASRLRQLSLRSARPGFLLRAVRSRAVRTKHCRDVAYKISWVSGLMKNEKSWPRIRALSNELRWRLAPKRAICGRADDAL